MQRRSGDGPAMVDVRRPSRRSSMAGPAPSTDKQEKAPESPSIYPVKRPSTAPKRLEQNSADAITHSLNRVSTVPSTTSLPIRKVSFSQDAPTPSDTLLSSQKRSSSRPSSAHLPAKSSSVPQQLVQSIAQNDQILDQTVPDVPEGQNRGDTRKDLEELTSLRQQVENRAKDVARLMQQVADRDKEIENLNQQLKVRPEVKSKNENDLGYSLEQFLKCKDCGRPNLYSVSDHPLLGATEDSRWLGYELDILQANGRLYSDIEQKLAQIKNLVEDNQMPGPCETIEPFFKPKPGTDFASFSRDKDPDDKLATKLADRNFSSGKRGKSFECGLIYTDCSQVLDVFDPPAVSAIEEIPSLMHKEINQFLTSRGLREFDSSTYNWFVIPGLPLHGDAKTFKSFNNAAVVIHHKDQNFFWNNKSLNSHLRHYLQYLAQKTEEVVRRLRVHEDCMEAFWQERSYFTKEVLSKQVWPHDARNEKSAKGLIAGMLAALKTRVVNKEVEATKLQVQLEESDKRGEQLLSSLREAKALLLKKDEAVAYYNHSLQTCRSQMKSMQSQSEDSECRILSMQYKLHAVAEPMCKIWTKAFLESVRRKISQELACAFADVIPLEERPYPHVTQSWNATLSKIYDTPDACALLASKGLHQDLLELTRVGAHDRDGQQTLQHSGSAAATIVRREQVAEAISSLDFQESHRNGLLQLYRYLYGSQCMLEEDRKTLVGP